MPLPIGRKPVSLTLNKVESPETGSLPSILFRLSSFSGSFFLKNKGGGRGVRGVYSKWKTKGLHFQDIIRVQEEINVRESCAVVVTGDHKSTSKFYEFLCKALHIDVCTYSVEVCSLYNCLSPP